MRNERRFKAHLLHCASEKFHHARKSTRPVNWCSGETLVGASGRGPTGTLPIALEAATDDTLQKRTSRNEGRTTGRQDERGRRGHEGERRAAQLSACRRGAHPAR